MKLLLMCFLMFGCALHPPTVFVDDMNRCWAKIDRTGELVQLPRYQCDKGWYAR